MTTLGTVYLNGCNYQVGYDVLWTNVTSGQWGIRIYGVLNVTNNNISWSRGSASAHTTSTSIGTYYSKGSYTLVSGDFTFSCDGNGNLSQYIGGSLSTTFVSGDTGGTISLHMDRYATLTYAEDFSDEGNPTIKFNSYGAFPLKCRLEFSNTAISRNADKNAKSCTFNLTDAERDLLRYYSKDKNKSGIREVVASSNGSSEVNWSYVDKNMTIVNANPTQTYTFEETNKKVSDLIGNTKADTIIQNVSNVKVTTIPKTLKFATTKSVVVENNSTKKTSSKNVSNNMITNEFRQGNYNSESVADTIYIKTQVMLEKGKEYTFTTNLDTKLFKIALHLTDAIAPSSHQYKFDSSWINANKYTLMPTGNYYFGLAISKLNSSTTKPDDVKNYNFYLTDINDYSTTIIPTTNSFKMTTTDSRGNTVSNTVTKTMINYQKVKINTFEFNRDNPTSSDIYLNANITYTQTKLGTKNNTPTIKWRLDNGSWQTLTSSQYEIDSTNSRVTITNLKLENKLIYTKQGTFYLSVSDLLTDYSDNMIVTKGIPVYDFGEHDFNINGELTISSINGDNPISINDIYSYSLEEKVIGKWIDNRNVYKKTIYAESVSKSGQPVTNINHNITNLDRMLDITFNISDRSNTTPGIGFINPRLSDDNADVGIVRVTQDIIGIMNRDARFGNRLYNAYITMIYIKTTDE